MQPERNHKTQTRKNTITVSLLEFLLKMRYTTFRSASRICWLFVYCLLQHCLTHSGSRQRNLALLSLMQSLLLSFLQPHDPSQIELCFRNQETQKGTDVQNSYKPLQDRYPDSYYMQLLSTHISDSIIPLFVLGGRADSGGNFPPVFSTLLHNGRIFAHQIYGIFLS